MKKQTPPDYYCAGRFSSGGNIEAKCSRCRRRKKFSALLDSGQLTSKDPYVVPHTHLEACPNYIADPTTRRKTMPEILEELHLARIFNKPTTPISKEQWQ